jgi:hypothetical protein
MSAGRCGLSGAAQKNVRQGRGLKIIEELVKALDGRFEQKFGTAGSTSTLVFPTGGQQNRPDKIDRSACAESAMKRGRKSEFSWAQR